MGRAIQVWLATTALALCACSKPEGIMLVISIDENAPIGDQLVIVAGNDAESFFGDGFDDSRLHIHDELGDEAVFIGERNLHDEPFRFFISASPEQGPLNVGAVAFASEGDFGDVVAAGALKDLSIPNDTVVEWELKLDAAQIIDDQNCFKLATPNGDVIVTTGTDYDCDGVAADEDCAPHDGTIAPGFIDDCEGFGLGVDNNCNGVCDEDGDDERGDIDGDGFTVCGADPFAESLADENFRCEVAPADCAEGFRRIHPGAGESCDGFDTDCTPQTLKHAPAVMCFSDEGECNVGEQMCLDDAAVGPNGLCEVGQGRPIDPNFCAAFSLCSSDTPPEEGPPLECAYEMLPILNEECVVEVLPDNTVCPTTLGVLPSNAAGMCSLEILAAGGANRIFGTFDGGALSSALCSRNVIRFGPGPGQAHSYDFLLHDEGLEELMGYARVRVVAKQVGACSPQSPCAEIRFENNP